MAEFGLSREPGIVVEGDSGHSLYGYPYSLFPDYGATEESAALNGVNKDTHVMLSVAQGLVLTETENVTAEPCSTPRSSPTASRTSTTPQPPKRRAATPTAPLHWPPGHATTTPERK